MARRPLCSAAAILFRPMFLKIPRPPRWLASTLLLSLFPTCPQWPLGPSISTLEMPVFSLVKTSRGSLRLGVGVGDNGCHKLWKLSCLDTKLGEWYHQTHLEGSFTHPPSSHCGRISHVRTFSKILLLRQGLRLNTELMDWLDGLDDNFRDPPVSAPLSPGVGATDPFGLQYFYVAAEYPNSFVIAQQSHLGSPSTPSYVLVTMGEGERTVTCHQWATGTAPIPHAPFKGVTEVSEAPV